MFNKEFILLTFLLLISSVAVAHTDGIYNRAANSVGDTQGIDSAVSSGVAALVCSYTPVTTGTQNVAYTGATPAASGGVLAYTFSETGSLPTGVTINSGTGIINGTPSVSGSFTNIQVKVTDSALTVANCGTAFTLTIAPSFQGVGDVVSGAIAGGSCARVYNAANASTATSLCDLVDSAAPTVTICTLRGTSTGFVDLTAYCPGSVTPAAKCAAATGGTCSVQKVYDQTGTGNHFTNVTAASQPRLTFNALNGLPGLTGTSAGATVMATTATFTQAQPFSFSAVAERTGNIATNAIISSASAATLIGFDIANLSRVAGGAALTEPATESVFHAIQGVISSTVGANNTDGTDSGSLSSGTNALSAEILRIFRTNGGTSTTGIIMETWMWPFELNATQRGNINTNDHSSTNGYGPF